MATPGRGGSAAPGVEHARAPAEDRLAGCEAMQIRGQQVGPTALAAMRLSYAQALQADGLEVARGRRTLPRIGRGASTSSTWRMVSVGVSARNGGLPASTSYRIAPSAYTSTAGASDVAEPRACSGASSSACRRARPVAVSPATSTRRARPKSVMRGVAVGRQQHVGRLQVAVDDALPVGVLGGQCQHRDECGRLLDRHQPIGPLRQARPVDQFHRVVRAPGEVADLVDRHDVGMLQLRRQLRLALETAAVPAAWRTGRRASS
jgi:hypothetical protein